MTPSDPTDRWQLRTVPSELRERYLADGSWTDETLGQMVAEGLSALAHVGFEVHSAFRPWQGTFADVDGKARALAGSLRARGVGPGDVVVFHLPNWVEAGVVFWASAYLGAVVVPIVHFYGAKEIGYIVGATEPAVIVSADRFGSLEYLDTYEKLLAERPETTWLVVGDTPADELPASAIAFDTELNGEPIEGAAAVDPDTPAIIAFTSGTTRDPKGVIHTHRTIGFECHQLNKLFPEGGPPQITGAPVGHFIGMLNAFLIPLLRERAVNLVDVWDPGRILQLMKSHRLGVGGGATFFMTSLLDHPDCTDKHLALVPFAGLGGSPVPAAVMERLERLGIPGFRSYGSTEHPSITGCSLDDPTEKRHRTDGPTLPSVEIRLDAEGEISSRGPDCFMGYIDSSINASVFDDDGWYRTGDVGVLDDDGFLTITDRVSDIIIRGGENISAQEVEEQLMGIEGIAEVAVVAGPDERFGEHAAAVVRMVQGHETPTLEKIREHLAVVGLAKQKWPESVYTVLDFPRTPSGKIQKFIVRQQLRDGQLGSRDV